MEQYSIKYRPRTLNEIFSQEAVKRDLTKRSKSDQWPKAMLFRGPFGTGKTTAAHIVAMNIQCEHKDEAGNACGKCASCLSIKQEKFDRDTMMLDGSQIGQKGSVIEFTSIISIRAMYDKRRVFIVEEADQLSSGAINALLKVLEDPKEDVHFILLSMQAGGIPPAIISRCQVFDFKPVGVKDTMLALRHILEEEQLWQGEQLPSEFKLQGLSFIAEASKGSLRSALQMLQQAVVGEAFTKEQLEDLFSSVDEVSTYKILDALTSYSDDEAVWHSIYKADPMELFNYITFVLADVMLYKSTGYVNNEQHLHSTKVLASRPSSEKLFRILSSQPQLAKPYMRKADLVSALALFYLDKPSVAASTPTTDTNSIKGIPVRRRVK